MVREHGAAKTEFLCREDLTAVITAREAFPRIDRSLLLDSLAHFPTGDPDHECHKKKDQVHLAVLRLQSRQDMGRDCIGTRHSLIRDVCAKAGICKSCTNACLEGYDEKCEDLLKELWRCFDVQVRIYSLLHIISADPRSLHASHLRVRFQIMITISPCQMTRKVRHR